MNNPEKGPHHIPELDPDDPSWRRGDGGRKALWITFLVGLVFLGGGAALLSFGHTDVALWVFAVGIVLMVPIFVGVSIF